MKKKSVLIVFMLALVFVLALAGTALAWAHGPSAAPILESVTLRDDGSGLPAGWHRVEVRWDTAGAKPLYAVVVVDDPSTPGTDSSYYQTIRRADLAAGNVYVRFGLATGCSYTVHLETRKGVPSDSVPGPTS